MKIIVVILKILTVIFMAVGSLFVFQSAGLLQGDLLMEFGIKDPTFPSSLFALVLLFGLIRFTIDELCKKGKSIEKMSNTAAMIYSISLVLNLNSCFWPGTFLWGEATFGNPQEWILVFIIWGLAIFAYIVKLTFFHYRKEKNIIIKSA